MADPSRFATADRLRRMLRTSHAERLAERARESGRITEAQLDDARRVAEEDGRPLTAILVDQGLLTAEALAELEASVARDEFTRPSTAVVNEAPPEVEEAGRLPDRRLGEFVLTEALGRGGAGVVWKAWDHRLGRWVAVKISTASIESISARERFEREALAVGRLAHPNIVPVFQVGTDGGRSFLVMPYIEGQTLDRASLPLRQALEVMHTVALAVEHAHQQGIVHRDIKPANLMIGTNGGVFVLDFGLAFLRKDTLSRLTRPGELLGTASYMAPEQARGDEEAPAATVDVYAMGATLYTLVTGKVPFTGDSFAGVVFQVVSSDPPPLRRWRPDLDPQVEAVVLKAMEKSPGRRYPSTAAFAADLRRLLDASPVDARAVGPLERLSRRVRRHLALSVMAAVLLVAVIAVGVSRLVVAHERRTAAETLREMARLSLDTALRLRRAGDTDGMRQVLPNVVAAYARVQERGAASAEVEYLMGRMYRALLDEERALQHQQRALEKDPTYVDALYERAVLLSPRYGRELAEAVSDLTFMRAASATTEDAERVRPELVQLRTQVVVDLTRLEALMPTGARTDAARGILAFHRSQVDEARALLSRPVSADPLIEEAWQTLASTEIAAGKNYRAEEIFTRALAVDRGYAPHLAGRCEVRRMRGRKSEAIADADQAVKLDPHSRTARLCRAKIRLDESHIRLMAGDDQALGGFDAAIDDYTHVLARREDPTILVMRGIVSRYRGMFLDWRSKDPTADFHRSEADFTRATQLKPTHADHWAGRGRTRTRRALHRIEHGMDPTTDLEGAQQDLDRAVKLFDTSPSAPLMWLGDVQSYRGLQALRLRQPAAAFFQAAEARYAESRRLSDDGWVHLLRGGMLTWRGIDVARSGGDPLPHWQTAESELDQAVKVFPRYVDPRLRRGILLLERARHLGPEGATDRAAGLADLQQAKAMQPDHREVLGALAALGDPALRAR